MGDRNTDFERLEVLKLKAYNDTISYSQFTCADPSANTLSSEYLHWPGTLVFTGTHNIGLTNLVYDSSNFTLVETPMSPDLYFPLADQVGTSACSQHPPDLEGLDLTSNKIFSIQADDEIQI